MTRFVRLLLLVLTPLLVAGLGTAAGAASPDPVLREPDPYVPPDSTIVQVQGDAANGFSVLHYDGSWSYPPTDSETMAECDEYDGRIRRVRCRVHARTWFKALAGFKQTTLYYRFRG